MLEVKSAKYVGEYKVRIEFSNGEAGVVDLESDLWRPIFEPLKDLDRFEVFEVSPVLHTLAWENGADFAPEHLLARLRSQSLQPA